MFMFDLEFDSELTEALGLAVEQACADRGSWPVHYRAGRVERRWFGIEKSFPSVLDIEPADGTGPILAVTAEPDAATLDLRRDAVPRLTATLRILDEHLDDGFALIATYSGSPIRHERTLEIDELVGVVERGELNEFTRYRVMP